MEPSKKHAVYPFLEESKEIVGEFDFERVFDEDVRQRAMPRIIKALNYQSNEENSTNDSTEITNDGVENVELIGERSSDYQTELLSYPLARMYASLLDDRRVFQKYAWGEANAAIERLKHETKHETKSNPLLTFREACEEFDIEYNTIPITEFVKETDSFDTWKELSETQRKAISNNMLNSVKGGKLSRGIREYLNRHISDNQEIYTVPIDVFLEYAPDINSNDYHLANKGMYKGDVVVTREMIYNFIRHAIFHRVFDTLPLDVPEEIEEDNQEYIDIIYSSIPENAFSSNIDYIEEEYFPPVIEQLLSEARSGVGMDHMARYTLAAFLGNIGATTDDIVEMVGSHWDNPMARKQINHIGEGGGTEDGYICPKYSRIEGYGVEWESDALEERVNHPLTYYRIKLNQAGIDFEEGLDEVKSDDSEEE